MSLILNNNNNNDNINEYIIKYKLFLNCVKAKPCHFIYMVVFSQCDKLVDKLSENVTFRMISGKFCMIFGSSL